MVLKKKRKFNRPFWGRFVRSSLWSFIALVVCVGVFAFLIMTGIRFFVQSMWLSQTCNPDYKLGVHDGRICR